MGTDCINTTSIEETVKELLPDGSGKWRVLHYTLINYDEVRHPRDPMPPCVALAEVIEARLTALLEPLGDLVTSYGDSPRGGVPSVKAYALLDALRAAPIAEAALLPGVVVTIGEIERQDGAETGTAVWRTGIDATITHPWIAQILITVLAEPLDYREVDTTDDDD